MRRRPRAMRARVERAVAGLARQTVLILDDYHLVTSGSLDMALARLLELGPLLHLIVLSRRFDSFDGPLITGRVRTAVLTGRAMAFTEHETAQLALLYGVHDPAHTSSVHEQTQGWPLVARSLLQAIADGGSGSDVMQLLELFARHQLDSLQLPGAREALLASLLCPQISLELLSELCEMQVDRVREVMGRLGELGLVTESRWFETSRYRCPGGLTPPLLALAVERFDHADCAIRRRHAIDLSRDEPVEAAKQLLDIEQYEAAATLFVHYFLRIMQPQHGILPRLRRIPDEKLQLHPALLAASLLLETAEVSTPQRRVDQLYRWLRSAVRSQMLEDDFDENIAVITALLVAERMRADSDQVRSLARDIEARTDRLSQARMQQYRLTMPLIFSALGLAGIVVNDLELGARSYGRAVDVATHFGILEEEARGRIGLARVAAASGEMPLAEQGVRQVQQLVSRFHLQLPQLSWINGAIAEAVIACERFDSGRALEALAELPTLLGRIEQWPAVSVVEAQACWISDGPRRALEVLEQRRVEPGAGFSSSIELGQLRAIFAARLMIASGDHAGAEAQLAGLPEQHADATIARASLLLFRADPAAALRASRGLEASPSTGSAPLTPRQRIEAGLIEAVSLWQLEQHDEAIARFAEAAQELQRNELRLPLTVAPFTALRTLARAARDAGSVDLVETVDSLPETLRCDPPEPLSKAELRTLQALCAGRTQTQIAAELFLSINTVKFHLKSIYRKLGVSDRSAAVERARSLQLLDAKRGTHRRDRAGRR